MEEKIIESTTNTMEDAASNVSVTLPKENTLAMVGGLLVAGSLIGGTVYLVKKFRGQDKEKDCLEAGEDVEVTETEIENESEDED